MMAIMTAAPMPMPSAMGMVLLELLLEPEFDEELVDEGSAMVAPPDDDADEDEGK